MQHGFLLAKKKIDFFLDGGPMTFFTAAPENGTSIELKCDPGPIHHNTWALDFNDVKDVTNLVANCTVNG